MLKRSIYTFTKMLKHSKQISMISEDNFIARLTDLTSEYLSKKYIKYLVLDFDGVIAPHGKQKPHREVYQWFNKFLEYFNQSHIFILSNKPTTERLAFFSKKYPQIRFILGVAKKPYPDGLLKIQQLFNCKSNEIALVDDRILTGCLACIIAGCLPIIITEPYVDMKNYNSKEKLLKLLRYVEQKFFL